MVPALATMRFIRAYAGVRPLVGSAGAADGRAVSRGFALFDHENHGLDNLATITGGKLTTCRLMAERTADLVCRRLGVSRPCVTATTPLPVAPECAWTEPGHAPRAWMRSHAPEDPLLCECEMVSAGAVDAIYAALRANGDTPTLTDIGLRSRVGKGACQGSFCAVRTVAHLYQRGDFAATRGLAEIVEFIGERWRSQRAVLWGEQLAQAELMEALHCGLFGEELCDADDARRALARRRRPQRSPARQARCPDDERAAGKLRCRGDRRRDGGHGDGAVCRGARSFLHPDRQRRRAPVRERIAGPPGRAPGGRRAAGGDPLTRRWRRSRTTSRSTRWRASTLRRSATRSRPSSRPSASAGLPYAPLGESNREVLTSIGTVKTTFGVPRSMVRGVAALDARPPCLLVDFRGLREFSARQIVATLGARWPGLRHQRIEFPGCEATPELYAAHLARALESGATRERTIALVRPLLGDAQAVGFPAVLGLAQSAAVHAAFERALGIPVFEIPTMPTSVPGLRLLAALEAAVADRGVHRRHQARVRALAFDATGDDGHARPRRRSRSEAGGGERVVARAVVLATGRFSGRGLIADRAGARESILGLPVFQPGSREAWHRRDFLDPSGHAINRAGLDVDDAWRPLDASGKPAWPRLYAVGSILAHQDWMRSKCGSGLAIATAWAAVDQVASDLRGSGTA